MMSPDDARLPPGQQLAAAKKWPLVGEKTPKVAREPWQVEIAGHVAHPQHWTLDDLGALPQREITMDIHCVTRWSKLDATFSGVPLKTLLEAANITTQANFVSFVAESRRGHSTSLPVSDAVQLGALVALEYEGAPLPTEHGGPVRVVVPGRYFYKSLKWLRRIELLAEDRLGFWEAEAGYHNRADPWREQRYVASSISKREAAELIASRNFAGRDLRSLDARGRDLRELVATDSLLRDADFRECNLQRANFNGSNLSNAHFQQADARGATFVGADCEGANFAGADLRGADFTDASLLAATFSPDAQIDSTTRIPAAQIASLMPTEAALVQQRIARVDFDD